MRVEIWNRVSGYRFKGQRCPAPDTWRGCSQVEPGGSQTAGLSRLLFLAGEECDFDLYPFVDQQAGILSLEAMLRPPEPEYLSGLFWPAPSSATTELDTGEVSAPGSCSPTPWGSSLSAHPKEWKPSITNLPDEFNVLLSSHICTYSIWLIFI